MTDLTPAPFRIPAAFILDRVRLWPQELAYGYQHLWISQQDVVRILEAKAAAGDTLTEIEERLLLLLPSDLDQVPALVESLAVGGQPDESRARVWMFLSLARLLDQRQFVPDPFLVIENLYSDFDYPEEMAPLVRFMPAPPGAELGLDAIARRWEEYVARMSEMYADRDTGSATSGPDR